MEKNSYIDVVMYHVNVFLVFTTVFSFVDATTTNMRYVYFEKERIMKSMNQTIVEATFNRNTFPACASTCSQISESVSLYWHEEAAKCYCNNQMDENALASSATGSIVYAHVTRVYEARRNSGVEETTYYINDGTGHDSCEELAAAGYRSPGIYDVTNNMPTGVKEMYCTMQSDDWTVFQKRFDGSVDFFRNWADYVNGFGSSGGEFWLGLEAIHQATAGRSCKLVILLEAESTHPIKASGYAKYSSFWIGGADTNYILHVSDFSGTDGIGDSFSYHNNQMFSTYDADNDRGSTNCAQKYKGAWWYNACHGSNLNGLYLKGKHTSWADGMEWFSPWDGRYSLLSTQMMFKCA